MSGEVCQAVNLASFALAGEGLATPAELALRWAGWRRLLVRALHTYSACTSVHSERIQDAAFVYPAGMALRCVGWRRLLVAFAAYS